MSKDKVSYQFKNGSVIENLAAAESSRGQRYTSGIIEECAKIDGKILNAVIIPTMAVDRNINGQVDRSEKINRRQLYMNLFSVKKLCSFDIYHVRRGAISRWLLQRFFDFISQDVKRRAEKIRVFTR